MAEPHLWLRELNVSFAQIQQLTGYPNDLEPGASASTSESSCTASVTSDPTGA